MFCRVTAAIERRRRRHRLTFEPTTVGDLRPAYNGIWDNPERIRADLHEIFRRNRADLQERPKSRLTRWLRGT